MAAVNLNELPNIHPWLERFREIVKTHQTLLNVEAIVVDLALPDNHIDYWQHRESWEKVLACYLDERDPLYGDVHQYLLWVFRGASAI